MSIHVSDSSGVVRMLRTGFRVDVQMVSVRQGEPELRTVVENVEVLDVPAPDGGRAVVNLLVTPHEGNALALADSLARIRLLLRNPRESRAHNAVEQ
jgi:Flp pilus assembly protein CpaB